MLPTRPILAAPLALALLVAALALPTAAHADGDPASDVLITDTLFVPYATPSAESVAKLRGVIDAARKAGQPVRVAIIHSPRDLGAVTSLFGRPQEYATLLSQELRNPVEPGARGNQEALLVVMAAGYATKNASPEAEATLRKIELPSDADPDTLAAAAGYGVQELAKANGRAIPATFDRPETQGGGGALTAILVILSLVVAIAALVVLRVRSAQRSGDPQSPGGNT